MKKVLVNRKKPNIHVFAVTAGKNEKGEYLNTGIDGQIMIMPGVNEFSEDQYKVLSAHPDWQQMIEDEEMVMISVPTAKEGGEVYPLSGMSSKQAAKVIRDTVKRELLDEWLSYEKRADVVKVINEQLKKLELPPPKSESDDKGE